MGATAADAITTVLQGAGAIGVIALALGWTCIRLYNDLKASQESRIKDAQEYAKGMAQAVQSLDGLTTTIEKVADKLETQR